MESFGLKICLSARSRLAPGRLELRLYKPASRVQSTTSSGWDRELLLRQKAMLAGGCRRLIRFHTTESGLERDDLLAVEDSTLSDSTKTLRVRRRNNCRIVISIVASQCVAYRHT
jgi:hypothetical protein